MSSLRRALTLWRVLAVVTGSLIGLSAQGVDPWIGTWKVNVAKSKYDPGPPPNSSTHKFEVSEGGFVKHTIDTVNAQGQTSHTEVSAKFDGKDYPVRGAQPNNTRSFKRIDDRTFEVTNKTDGKVTNTVREVVSRDGKTKTGTQTGKTAQGQPVNNTIVFDKQ
jgi:hypothetical protein